RAAPSPTDSDPGHFRVEATSLEGYKAANASSPGTPDLRDNLPRTAHDGENRNIDLLVPQVEPATRKGKGDQRLEYKDHPETDDVLFHYEFDAHARPASRGGTGTAAPRWEARYGDDKKGRSGAGFLQQVKQGELTAELKYDERGNVERRESSWG